MKVNSKAARLAALLLSICLILPVFGRITASAATKYYIYINKGTNVVTVYDSGTKEPVVAFACSVGYGNNTPNGDFKLGEKYVWHTLMGPSYGQYCTRITTGVLFHPVWYYVNGDKATQSTAQYNKLGSAASHGCVRLTAAAAIWIYDNCASGTPVHIFWGDSSNDPLGKPQTIQVSTATRYGWDPTDPDPANPFETGRTKPKITVSGTIVEYGTKFKNNNMTAVDSGGFDCTSWVKAEGKVNTSKLGEYSVKYSVLDSFGRTAEKTVKYQVVEPQAPALSGVKESLVKEFKSSRDMLVGLSASTFTGKEISKDKIRVYVMTPGETKYHKLTEMKYKFTSTGKYKVKYAVSDPGNKLQTVLFSTIRVVDSGAPKHKSSSDWEDISFDISQKKISFEELVDDEVAVLACGEDRTGFLTVRVIDVNGEAVEIKAGESYDIVDSGDYEIEYVGSSAIKNLKTEEFEYTYANRMLHITDEASPTSASGAAETSEEESAGEEGEGVSTENTAAEPTGELYITSSIF